MCLLAPACTEPAPPLQGPDLEYRLTKWFPGLGEEITLIKSPVSMRAERVDGTVVDYARLLEENRRAWRDRHGAATQGLSDRLRSASPEEMIPVAIAYSFPELQALRQLPRGERPQAVEAAISSHSQPIASWLASLGFVESRRATLMPAIFGAMPARALAEVVHDGRLDLAELDEPLEVTSGGEYAAYDAMDVHAIDDTWNTCGSCGSGNYGVEVPVSMIEWCGSDSAGLSRGIYGAHAAFSELTSFGSGYHVGYAQTPDECDGPEDCDDLGGCPESTLACKNGQCVSKHASEVASIIAATKAGGGSYTPSGAAKVRLFLANAVKPNTVSNYELSYASAIFGNEDAILVNETHQGINLGGNFRVADYYAYTYDVQPIQSAGNSSTGEACKYSSNAICVGATTHAGTVASYSSYLNVSGTDREEPDITAFAGDVPTGSGGTKVIGFSSTTNWSGEKDGTSFSAPVITNMLAHMLAGCPELDNIEHPLQMRAIIRTAGWAANPYGNLYETPSSTDGRDGGGWVDATALDWFCAGTGTDGVSGVLEVDLNEGSAPQGTSSEFKYDTLGIGVRPLDYETDAHDTSRREYDIAETGLTAGDRVRATISWYACTTTSDGLGASLVFDWDLFLLKMDPVNGNSYVMGSQSFDDNNEGFDFEVPATGDYKLVISRLEGETDACGDEVMDIGIAARWGSW